MYVRHPELAAAKENRDYVLKQVCEAINTISDVAQGKIPPQNMLENAYEGPGELAAALDDFDVSISSSVRFMAFSAAMPVNFILYIIVIIFHWKVGINWYKTWDFYSFCVVQNSFLS